MTATLQGAGPNPPLRGRTLVFVRAVWALVTVLVLGLVITGTPIRYDKVRTTDPYIRNPEFRDLIAAGVDPELAAAADVAEAMLLFIPLLAGGIFLFLRASESREASFLSVTLILYAASFSGLTSVHRTPGPPFSQPVAGLVATVQFFLQGCATFTAPFWLPTGRFVPRWTAWLTVLLIVILAGFLFFVSFPRSHDLWNTIGLPVVVLNIAAQLYHYRIADPLTRQQIKWAVVGIIVTCVGFFVWQTATLLIGQREDLMLRIVMVVARLFAAACQVALLVCFAIAILRYRLWRIDLVINRALVYGTVTVLLVLVFLGGGFGLQSVAGQGNAPIAFAISIIAAGLLLNPARNRAQAFVDRRLYGFRFDLNELHRAQQLPEIKNPGVFSGRTLGGYRVLGVVGKGVWARSTKPSETNVPSPSKFCQPNWPGRGTS